MHPVQYLQTRHWDQARSSLSFDWSTCVPYRRDTMWHTPAPDPPEIWFTTAGRKDQHVAALYERMMYATLDGLEGRPLDHRVWVN